MRNKLRNKTIKTVDFKGFILFVVSSIQKINELIKDRKFNSAFSQQPVGQFTQQGVAQLKAVHFSPFLGSQNASLESLISFRFQNHRDAERQLNTEGK